MAEQLGYDSSGREAYGSDAVTPLAYLAAVTDRIRLGTGIMQLAARTAANCAMSVATVDAMAGGNRFIAGIGVSGPQIVEGWYGEPWGKPYYRIRDYVQIMRKIFERERPVMHEGREISLPYGGEGSSGLGKPLRSILHMNKNIPIWLGTGPRDIRLTARRSPHGWLPLGYVPGKEARSTSCLVERAPRAGGGKGLKGTSDPGWAPPSASPMMSGRPRRMKPAPPSTSAAWSPHQETFPNDNMVRRGYADAAARIQELFLAGRKEEATAAVPDEFLDETALIGPVERIRERYKLWADDPITGITVNATRQEEMELMAELAEVEPVKV